MNAVYDASSPILNVDKKEDSDTFFNQIQEDFYNKVVVKSDVLNNYCSNPKNIHIVQTFASSNDVIVPEFAIDNYGIVPFYTFCDMWNSPLTFGKETINPINTYVPVVYTNHSFIRIDEAFKKGYINNQTAKEVLNKLPNHNPSSNQATYPYEENQSFYNRVIIDYYEQKVLRPNCVNKFFRKGLNNYDYSGVKMEGPDEYVVRDFRLPSIKMLNYGKSSNGAYLFLFSDERYSANDGYTDAKDTKLVIDGNVFHIGWLYLPFVWYKGLILFFSEAYYIGLISKEEISRLLLEKREVYDGFLSFDYFACPLNIVDRFEIDSETPLYELKNDYYQYLLSNGVSSIDDSGFSQNDVHIIEYYGKIGDKELVSVQVDNVAIQNYWENDLVINEIRFDKYQPLIHFNKQFYTIREAYESSVLNDEELVTMSEFLNTIAN